MSGSGVGSGSLVSGAGVDVFFGFFFFVAAFSAGTAAPLSIAAEIFTARELERLRARTRPRPWRAWPPVTAGGLADAERDGERRDDRDGEDADLTWLHGASSLASRG